MIRKKIGIERPKFGLQSPQGTSDTVDYNLPQVCDRYELRSYE